jgi:hypothetical protein
MTSLRRYGSTLEFAYAEHRFVLDGRVLEYFHEGVAWESKRIHVSRLAVYMGGPDRKGRTEFVLQPTDVEFNRLTVKLPPEQVEPMRRFVAAMTAARDAPGEPL